MTPTTPEEESTLLNPIQHSKRRSGYALLAAAGVVIIALLIGGAVVTTTGDDPENASAQPEQEAPDVSVPSAEEDERDCPDTWKIVQVDHEDSNRWFADGVQEIEEADTPEEAREASRTWLSLVRRDPQLLEAAAKYARVDRQVDTSALVDGECASEEAELLTAEIELALAQAKITPEEAPADGTNSGTNADGNVTSASQAGITGNRTAIKIEFKDGHTIWIMARCGNPVVKGPAPVPPGPTDQPPPTTTTRPPTAQPPPPPPQGGKDDTESGVSDDRNDPEERERPNIEAPEEVIRPEPEPGSTTTTQPPPPTTMPEDPPEVQDPEPVDDDTDTSEPTSDDPVEDGPCGDADGDGIPDDC